MGVDFRDYDNDGRPDLIITNLAKQIYAVYHNEGNGSFTYRSLETGIGTLSAPSSGWGVRFETSIMMAGKIFLSPRDTFWTMSSESIRPNIIASCLCWL